MTFSKWSNLNTSAISVLKPDFGIRSWTDLEKREKETIWQHFVNSGWFDGAYDPYYFAILKFSNDHKARRFCAYLLAHGGPHIYVGNRRECCANVVHMDAKHIFMIENQDVVYELLSYYANEVIKQKGVEIYLNFVKFFNDLSNQFGLNILLSESGLILRQDPKIVSQIYEPTLRYLSDDKWKVVNREFSDSFSDYLKNTPEGFSSSITHTVSGVQAFLQILVNDEVGKGDISKLLATGIQKKIIPNDAFSAKILKDITSILMQERQSKSDSHPKEEYGNEKVARLLLNLSMVFMQHCLQP